VALDSCRRNCCNHFTTAIAPIATASTGHRSTSGLPAASTDADRRDLTETTPTFAYKQQSFTARMLQGSDAAAMIRMSIRGRHLSLTPHRKWRDPALMAAVIWANSGNWRAPLVGCSPFGCVKSLSTIFAARNRSTRCWRRQFEGKHETCSENAPTRALRSV
jgi:hypothetical protein